MAILATLSLTQLALVAFLLWERHTERRDHARQIESLCQRIQAPQSAVALFEQAQLPPSPAAISPDDDEAWHRSRGMSRDEMVAQMEAS